MELLTCGLIIVFLLVVIIFLAMELVKAKLTIGLLRSGNKGLWREGWEAHKWHERGKSKMASPK